MGENLLFSSESYSKSSSVRLSFSLTCLIFLITISQNILWSYCFSQTLNTIDVSTANISVSLPLRLMNSAEPRLTRWIFLRCRPSTVALQNTLGKILLAWTALKVFQSAHDIQLLCKEYILVKF